MNIAALFSRLSFFVLCCLAIVALYAVVVTIPMNNDEASIHHGLACFTHPLFQQDHFSISQCNDARDLITFFELKIPRSLEYIGFWPTILYAPIFFVQNGPAGWQFFGVLFLVLFAFFLSRLSRDKALTIGVAIASFPLVMGFVHDMGPIKYTILLYPVGALLVSVLLSKQGWRAFGAALLLSLMVVLSFEEKPFILYLLPSLLLFWAAFAAGSFKEFWSRVRTRWSLILFAGTIVCFGIGTLLLAKFPSGMAYWELLQRLSSGESMPSLIYAAGRDPIGYKIFKYFLFWPSYAYRFVETDIIDAMGNVHLSLAGLAFFAVATGMLYALPFGGYIFRARRAEIQWIQYSAVCLVLSLLGLIVAFGFSVTVYAPHHFIYIWPVLLLLFSDALASMKPGKRLLLVLLYAGVNLASLAWLAQQPLVHEVSPEREAISAYFTPERAEKSVIHYVNWGGHLLQSLYGPKDQLVTYAVEDDAIQNLYLLSRRLDRDFYFVCKSPDRNNMVEQLYVYNCSDHQMKALVKTTIGEKATYEEVLPDLKVWHLFRVHPN